jgi:hypothetical protein
MGGPTLLEACRLLLEACAFFLIQYLASMRSVFCAANSLNVNVVHFIIIPFCFGQAIATVPASGIHSRLLDPRTHAFQNAGRPQQREFWAQV